MIIITLPLRAHECGGGLRARRALLWRRELVAGGAGVVSCGVYTRFVHGVYVCGIIYNER